MPRPIDSERPVAVLITGPQPLPEELVEPILWGLEEEGIPAQTQPGAAGTLTAMAKQAADSSALMVAIAVSAHERTVVLHHRELPAEDPLFVLGPTELEQLALRRLGANAARLVKGNPLLVEDRPAPAVTDGPTEVSRDLVEQIATLVVARLLSEGDGRFVSTHD